LMKLRLESRLSCERNHSGTDWSPQKENFISNLANY
jgi:hypothetical protein